MDNPAAEKYLREGARLLSVEVSDDGISGLLRYRDELLKWNKKVNLTAITEPLEVLEKHFLDSLAVMPEVAAAKTVLDVGAGAGLPGIPLKLARRDLDVTLVDTVGKKVAFMKSALAVLGLAQGGRAVHVRIEGKPEAEKLGRYDCLIARAFTDVGEWVALAKPYLNEGGRIVAMLGRTPGREALEKVAANNGLRLLSEREYALPYSRDPRAVAVFG